MRSSLLARSVVAVASLAIGSVALAAVPASAATPTGVTRDQVLTAAAGLRAGIAATPAQRAALTDVIARTCGVQPGEEPLTRDVKPFGAGDDADGFIASVTVYVSGRSCHFAALATTDASFQLSGTVNLTKPSTPPGGPAVVLSTSGVSGDVFVTTPVTESNLNNVTAAAAGNATKTTTVATTAKVADKKSKSEKKAAKKKYEKRIKIAKKSYKKAVDKAGGSKSKKAAAKKVYKAKRATAKAKYRTAIAGFKFVTRSTPVTENRPFSLLATSSFAF